MCDYCKLPIGGERWIKISDRLYHLRCWQRRRAPSDQLHNPRLPDGELVCPACGLGIRGGDGTTFVEGYAVHVACAREPG
jgi:hypothetical protein